MGEGSNRGSFALRPALSGRSHIRTRPANEPKVMKIMP